MHAAINCVSVVILLSLEWMKKWRKNNKRELDDNKFLNVYIIHGENILRKGNV